MQTIKSIFLLLIIWFTFFTCNDVEAPKSEESKPLSFDSSVRTGTLENGLTYYIKHNKKPENRAEFRLAVNAGSNQEDDDQQGLAHFTEHMAFNGTKHFEKNDLINYLESVGTKFGAHLNAYTSFDETVYMFSVPTDSTEIVNKGFQILRDWADGLSFDTSEIDKERGVVGEEWRLRLGANERMRKIYWPIIYEGSRYADRMPIGQKEVIDTAHYEAFTRFYKDWYRTDLMAVIIVGDVNVDSVENNIKKYFADIPASDNPRKKELYPVPDYKEPLVTVVTDEEATYTNVQISYRLEKQKIETEEDFRNLIIRRLYTGMLNNRFEELKSQENPPFSIAYAYYGGGLRTIDEYVSAAYTEESEVKKATEVLLTENQRVKQHGFTPTELERQKKAMLREVQKALKEKDKIPSNQLVWEYINHYLEGTAAPGIENEVALYKRFLPTIELTEVNELADKWIKPSNSSIVVTAPEKEGLELPKEEELLTLANEIDNAQVAAYVDAFKDEPLVIEEFNPKNVTDEKVYDDLGITELKLENGVRVILKPTDFKNDEVIMRAFSYGGASLYPEENDVAASYAGQIINKSGVGNFNHTELKKKLKGKIVSVKPYTAETSEGFTGSASPEDLKTMMELIYLYFTAPRKDEVAFKAYLDEEKGFLENRNSSPEVKYYKAMQEMMYNNHPRRQLMDLERLKLHDLDKSYEVFKDRFKDASDFTFIFVGSFDVDSIKALSEKYLANLPATNRTESWKDMNIRYTKGIQTKIINEGIEPKSRVSLIFTGDYRWSEEENFEMQAMIDVLKIKLRETLREDMGGVYGVGAYKSTRHHPHEDYSITISFSCDPENTEDLIAAAEKEVRNIQSKGAGQIDLNKVKKMMVRSRETDLKENKFWSRLLFDTYFNQEEIPNLNNYNEEVNALKSEDIMKTANKYMDFQNYSKAILLPKENITAGQLN